MGSYSFLDYRLDQRFWMGKDPDPDPVPELSFTVDWQIALVASGGLLGSQLIIGIISFMKPVYRAHRYHLRH